MNAFVIDGLKSQLALEPWSSAQIMTQKNQIQQYDYFKDGRAYHVILEKATKTNPHQPYYLISGEIFDERSTEKAFAVRDWSGEKYWNGKPASNRFKWIAKSICIDWNGGVFAPSWALSDAYFSNHEYGCSSISTIVKVQ